MQELDKNYWQSRYEATDTPWDAGSITAPIKNYFDKIDNKAANILIPGAGNAHEAVYLFNKGFKNVFVCDWAPSALANISNNCPNFPKAQLLEADFFQLPYKNYFDFIIEQTFFCAINPALRANYPKKMQSLLKTNGKLVGLLFNFPFDPAVGPPFGGSEAEYISRFAPLFSHISIQPAEDSIKPRAGKELWIELTA